MMNENTGNSIFRLLLLVAVCSFAMSVPALAFQNGNDTEPDPEPRVTLPDESKYKPSPSDGGGRVVVSPNAVTAGQAYTLTFEYAAGEQGVSETGGVLMYVTNYWHWSPPQNQSPEYPGFVTVSADSDAEIETTVDPRSQTVLARVVKGRLSEGDTVTFVYGDTGGGERPSAAGRADRYAEHRERFFFKVDGDGDGFFTPIESQPRFDVKPGEAARIVVFGPSTVTTGDAINLRISALDAANNLVTTFGGKLSLTFNETLLEGPTTIQIKPGDDGTVGVNLTAKSVGLAKIRAAVDGKEQRIAPGESNTILINDSGESRYKLYWGDLQIHGNLSDGTGTPDDIHRYARDVARLDACALTEHDHWGYLPLEDNPADWRDVLDTADRYNHDGKFVAFCAYEWTNWTFGHQHVLFANRDDAVIWSWRNEKSDRPDELWKRLDGIDCITIPHHCGGGPIPTCWKYYDPTFQPVVELVSVHGISERMGQPGGIYAAVESGMVQSALARGYRLGMIGSGDTHDGHPGIGTPGMPPPGLAGIYAESLTRESILAAIRDRRVYATNGNRMILRFHADITPMGGVLKLTDRDTPRRFQIAAVGDAPIENVTIVKNNRDQAVLPGDGFLFSETWEDSAPARDGDYYYVRITQTDGGQAWSSPIWIELEAHD